MIIGITGGTGSGKSAVCKAAAELGFCVIDADEIGHNILIKGEAAYNEITAFFGTGVLGADGEIDRKKLGSIVFADREKLNVLNKITHGRIDEKIDEIIRTDMSEVKVIDAALLFESGIDKKCDKIIAVIASEEIRIKRLAVRDGMSTEDIRRRLASQRSGEFFASAAGIVIRNEGGERELYDNAVKILKEAAYGKK